MEPALAVDQPAVTAISFGATSRVVDATITPVGTYTAWIAYPAGTVT